MSNSFHNNLTLIGMRDGTFIDKSIQRRKLFVKIQYLPSFSMGVKEPRGGAPGAL